MTDPAQPSDVSPTTEVRPDRPAGARSRGVVGLVAWVVASLVLAAVAGLVWAWLAQPAEWVVTDDGRLLLSEQASTAQIGVEMLYVGLGLVVSFAVAALGTWRLRRLGWVLVPVAAVSALAGALVAWRVGVLAGPAGTENVSGPVAPGDTIEASLDVASWGSFLVWPVAALVAVVLVVWVTDRPASDRSEAGVGEAGFSEPGEPAPRS